MKFLTTSQRLMTNDNHDNVTTDEFFLKIFDDLFVDRTPDVVHLQCQK